MALFASKGFDKIGGIGIEEYEKLVEKHGSTEGLVFHVISQPSLLPSPTGINFTQYTTCFLHNLHTYLEHGWEDEGFESVNEKDCIDWICTKSDCTFEAVLKNNPGLATKMLKMSQISATAEQMNDRDMRRGKYI